MIIQAKNISKTFSKNGSPALKDVSLKISPHSTHGLVGESGSGKSTLARIIADLEVADQGEILYKGENIRGLKGDDYMNYRSNVQFIFQDPKRSMNPNYTVGKIIEEPLLTLRPDLTKGEISDKVSLMLNKVGLSSDYLDRFPGQLSGGQCQRVGIARALVVEPELIIADEAVSALDVSVQAQILNLLKEIQKEYSMSYLFISHDISLVRYMSDDLTVMYQGEVVEKGNCDDIITSPKHDYTKKLIEFTRRKSNSFKN